MYLVSGGFRRFIEPLAELLDIPRGNVHANRLIFNEQGTVDSPCILSVARHSSTSQNVCPKPYKYEPPLAGQSHIVKFQVAIVG